MISRMKFEVSPLSALLSDGAFRRDWERWMRLYGDRSPDELKLESPTLRDTPEFLLASIRAWVAEPPRNFGDSEKATRAAAERDYAVAIDAAGAVDEARTTALRAAPGER